MANYNTAFQTTNNQYDQRYDILYQNQHNFETIPSVIVVDSQYRDNPSDQPGDYTTTLIKKYPDVTSIELVFADIPNSNYNIGATTDTLHVMTSGGVQEITYTTVTAGSGAYTGTITDPGGDAEFTVTLNSSGVATSVTIDTAGSGYDFGDAISLTNINSEGGRVDIIVTVTPTTEITVPVGLYQMNSGDSTDLGTQLKTTLDSTLPTVSWDVSVYQATDTDVTSGTYPSGLFKISTDISFALKNTGGSVNAGLDNELQLYNTDSMSQLLGFKPITTGSTHDAPDGSHNLVAPYPVALEMDHYIGLFIEGIERCDSNYDVMQGAFCIVPMDATLTNFGLFKDSNNIDNDQFKYYFPQPRKLAELKITFKDWEGNIYDFQGLNHTLIFKVDTATHSRKFAIEHKNQS
jgi:hypothetical protein